MVTPDENTKLVTVMTPLEKIPVMLRGGAIIPRRERIRRSSALMHGDPFTLVVALDEAGEAKGSLYSDDGKSYKHQKGEYHYVDFSFSNNVLNSGVMDVPEWGKSIGGKEISGRVERVILVGYTRSVSKVVLESDETGTVQLSYTEKNGVIVVKDPKVWIGKVFSISFE